MTGVQTCALPISEKVQENAVPDLARFGLELISFNVQNFIDASIIDLVIRWGGRRRLSGFLPVQTVYSDFYVLDDYWPDFKPQHFYDALEWYSKQDITLGG